MRRARVSPYEELRLMTFPLTAEPPGREAALQDIASADLELVDHQALDGRVLFVEYRQARTSPAPDQAKKVAAPRAKRDQARWWNGW